MVPLETIFLGLVLLFGMIGALRGWVKELLVTFATILARFLEIVLRTYVPVIGPAFNSLDPQTLFYVRVMLFLFVIFFGYATPVVAAGLGQRARKEKVQDTLLGFFIGALNGYAIVGVFWGFLHNLGYNLWGIQPPQTEFALDILNYLPLAWLDGGLLFVSVAVAFALVLIVFV
jgi:uncharacterized membrane protein required for colicin V production